MRYRITWQVRTTPVHAGAVALALDEIMDGKTVKVNTWYYLVRPDDLADEPGHYMLYRYPQKTVRDLMKSAKQIMRLAYNADRVNDFIWQRLPIYGSMVAMIEDGGAD